MEKLNGKVVLLTGGSRGMGPIIAEALAKRGAVLALAARSQRGLDDVATHLREFGAKALAMPIDLRQSAQREQLVADVQREYGRIDVLINNAGLETEGPFTELPWTSIQETIEVNLVAPMALTRLVLPGMLERKAGHIVNIASIAAKSGAPYAATYSGTKAGLAEWTRALRLELANTGVQFSTIFPGYVREVGMFAKFGVQPPWLVGSCAPSQVAKAVVQVIEKNRREKIVNSRPLRYSFVANELSPTFGDWLMRISGLVDFQRRKVGKRGG
ncbi:MAG: SDR family NAD(P)-dependent oxidoreductase [Coprothermobacterota bacterium]|nr:SDR family NAD(P)-dependent oxidoreductase [Coprothermobacterota bacterium]